MAEDDIPHWDDPDWYEEPPEQPAFVGSDGEGYDYDPNELYDRMREDS
ncbi:MAG: hypothetical protein IJ092_03055 [Atopobiaceae bacterium]|nr:hypothetical protein [Atopobiaceae bacterium]